MLKFLLGIAIGFVAGYLYGSERAQDAARRRLSDVPEPVRRTTDYVASRIAAAPVPDVVKQTATRATAAVQSATDQAAQAAAPAPSVATPTPAEIVTRPSEPLPRNEPEA